MIDSIKRFWNARPLLAILIIALIPRLVAAVYSKGYGMHDDHFGPIEQPFQIMHDITYWSSRTTPHGHSIVYPSLHYLLFNGFEVIGIRDPQDKMLVVRLIHAFYSLLIVAFGYKIAQRFSSEETARRAGLVLALFWALPFLSVRNLIEVVCIPPLMAGFYYVLKSQERRALAFWAGAWFGLAFAFRYQTLSVAGTVAILLLVQKEFRSFLLFSLGCFVSALVIQGSADVFAWGYPFASFLEYFRYNAAHGLDYTTGPWYNYTLLLVAAFVPPTSFFLLYGFVRNWRKTLLVFLPVLVFFVLHSYFPNKQERFILPVVPPIITLSVIGWGETVRRSQFWMRHRSIVRSLWVWFWAVNVLLLVPFTVYYSKKSRVEAMYALCGKPLGGLVLVGGSLGTTQPPLFYSDQYPVDIYEINDDAQLASVKSRLAAAAHQPNYAVFFGPEDLEQRKHRIEMALGETLTLEKKNAPSFLDDVFYRLNPKHNKNQTTYVFRMQRIEGR